MLNFLLFNIRIFQVKHVIIRVNHILRAEVLRFYLISWPYITLQATRFCCRSSPRWIWNGNVRRELYSAKATSSLNFLYFCWIIRTIGSFPDYYIWYAKMLKIKIDINIFQVSKLLKALFQPSWKWTFRNRYTLQIFYPKISKASAYF